MPRLIISAFVILLFYAAPAQIKKNTLSTAARLVKDTSKPIVREKARFAEAAVTQQSKIDNYKLIDEKKGKVSGIFVDTIPKHMYKFYTIDKSRYLKYLHTNLNDSVKLVKANNKDWTDFDAAYTKLQLTLNINKYNNVTDYINLNKDFKSLGLINKQFQSNTARVCLRQLIYNIKVSDILLNKELTDTTELKLLSMSINNIDTLCLAYIVPYVNKTMALMRYPKVIFKVLDSTGTELKNTGCYLVTPYVCRSVGCVSCKNIANPCETQKLTNIINQHDYFYDCANATSSIELAPGLYHLFIINNNSIIGYQFFDTSAYEFQFGQDANAININLK